MAGIQLNVELDDNGTPKIEKVDKALKDLGKRSDKTGSKWKKTWSNMGKVVGKVQRKVRGFATSMPALLGAAGLAGSFGYLMKQGIAFNAQLESIETQFRVIVGSADKAKKIMASLVKFSASTPFQLGEIANAAKILTAFGLEGTTTLRMVGDAAAAAQRPIEEVAMIFGRIKSGAFGEAFMRLAEMGLATREMLEAEGLQFNKGGSYIGSAEDAMAAVGRIVNKRFSGMMGEMSKTWNGAWSTMKDNWSLFVGELNKPLFDKLKPRLDQLTAIFQSWKKSGAIKILGIELAKWVDKAAEKILGFMEKIETLYKYFLIGKTAVAGFFGSIWAGFQWVSGIAGSFFTALKDDFIAFKQAMVSLSSGNFLEIGDSLKNAGGDWGAVAGAASAEGFMAKWREMTQNISNLMNTTFTFTTDQEDNEDSDWEGASTETDPLFASQQQLVMDLQALWEGHTLEMKSMWENLYMDLIDVGAYSFMDAFAETILNKNSSLKENLEAAWRGMKEAFVRSAFDMAAGWIASRVKMAIAEKLLKKAAVADEITSAAVAAGAAKTQAGAAASAGAAKYHMAYAAIPFAGPMLAATAITAMNTQILASQALAGTLAFRAGGGVPGAGSGVEDNRIALVSGGEFIHPKSAVDQYGEAFMEAVRTGTYAGGGEGDIHVHIPDGASSDFERDVEDLLVPVLETLFRQRRLSFA